LYVMLSCSLFWFNFFKLISSIVAVLCHVILCLTVAPFILSCSICDIFHFTVIPCVTVRYTIFPRGVYQFTLAKAEILLTYSWGAWFEFWPRHWVFGLRTFVFFFTPSRQMPGCRFK
jgi:hypothetical protein